MIRILIVDDEPMARMRIRNLIENCSDDYAVAEACDGIDALGKISEFEPDIVFLDIDMPEMTGFEVLENLETIPFAVVFQTAYHEFAVRAFQVNACDYILKPFSDERWHESLERAKRRRAAENLNLDNLSNHLRSHDIYLTRLVIRSGMRNHLIRLEEVTHFTSEEHMTFVHTENRNYAYNHSLTFLEHKLDPQHFVRVHRNAIVNLERVKTFSAGAEGTITLNNGAEVKVSREKRRRLRELLAVVTEDDS